MKFINTTTDPWQSVSGEAEDLTLSASSLLSLEQWQAAGTTFAQPAVGPGSQRVGVSLSNTDDPSLLSEGLSRLALIVLHFPKWTDGRAYSQARLLRSRLKFKGELRATGEVLVDMLPLLQRTGFDAVVLKAGQSQEAAERALAFFEHHYQSDAVDGQPVFLRSTAATSGATTA